MAKSPVSPIKPWMRLRARRKRRIRKSDGLISGGLRGTQGFHAEKEEKLMVGDDRAPNGRRDVVAVKRGIGRTVYKFSIGKHLLVIKILADQAVEIV